MATIGLTLIIWGVVLLVIGGVVITFGVKFFLAAKQYKEDMEKSAEIADKRLRKGYNRIATMEVEKLHSYLSTIFTRCLEITIDKDISKKDPDAVVALMPLAEEQMMLYLGDETIEAIEYYYGLNYIHRWVELSYRILEKRGIISSWISDRSMRSDIAEKVISK